VLLAEIVKPHGLHGEVTVQLHTDFPERLVEAHGVLIRGARDGRVRRMRVASIRPMAGGRALMKLAGVDDVAEAGKLRGCSVLLDRQDVPPPPEGAYYDFQIVGLRVVTTAGREVGRVIEVIRTGANDVYATEHALIPAADDVIKSIDLERGEILIEEVAGLLE